MPASSKRGCSNKWAENDDSPEPSSLRWSRRIHPIGPGAFATRSNWRRKDNAKAAAEFEAAQKALEAVGNLEGLSAMLLARGATDTQSREDEYKDLERVVEIGNRYNSLIARIRMASVFDSQRDYDRAIETAREAAEEARRENLPVVTAQALAVYGYGYTAIQGQLAQAELITAGRRSPSPNAAESYPDLGLQPHAAGGGAVHAVQV